MLSLSLCFSQFSQILQQSIDVVSCDVCVINGMTAHVRCVSTKGRRPGRARGGRAGRAGPGRGGGAFGFAVVRALTRMLVA